MSTERGRIAVLGAGSWGTALAILLARNGYTTYLWGHDTARVEDMAQFLGTLYNREVSESDLVTVIRFSEIRP